MSSFTLVTNEFLPVGLLSDIHRDLRVSEGTAGSMVTAPGIVAAFSALALPVLLQRFNRRGALIALSLAFVLADVLAGLVPTIPSCSRPGRSSGSASAASVRWRSGSAHA